jgi:hypothetical protein
MRCNSVLRLWQDCLYRIQCQGSMVLQLEKLRGSICALFKHRIIIITATDIWKTEGQCKGDICPACNAGTTKICRVWRCDWTYWSRRHAPLFVPHDIQTWGPHRQKPPRCEAKFRFAHNTQTRKVLQHSAADNETGTRRRLDCDRLYRDDGSERPALQDYQTAIPGTKHTQIRFRDRNSCGDGVKM